MGSALEIRNYTYGIDGSDTNTDYNDNRKTTPMDDVDYPVHLTIDGAGSDENATADNVEKNAAETAEKEKKHRLHR